ncbi:hypothetical protein H5410_012281 [Solanum commersonii]|uniref:Uncharacterized protein n=1 Tax=Solanum commersonii TaxID=4109 RepID=A0A9J6ASG1_SOLCO|nr:hypothetical protein H5410_012281 [Solanum commersonii]
MPVSSEAAPEHEEQEQAEIETPQVRRPTRERREPAWHSDYSMESNRENGIGKLMKNNEEGELCSVYTEKEFFTIDYPPRYSYSEYLRFYLSVMGRV